jgi:hypothetical protein
VLEGVIGHLRRGLQERQPQRPVELLLLGPLEGDLELAAPRRRLGVEQLGGRHPERLGQLVDQREAGLALARLDLGEVRRRPSDEGAERLERHAA